jgi:hypothetical protein
MVIEPKEAKGLNHTACLRHSLFLEAQVRFLDAMLKTKDWQVDVGFRRQLVSFSW